MNTDPSTPPIDLATTAPPPEAATLEAAIEQMASLREKPWARMGQMLLEIEQTKYWEEQGASSFGEYVALLAERINLDQSVLWRNRKAVEFYETELRELIQSAEGTLPALAEKPPKIGPEGLSLLERIGRVAPKEVYLDLAMQSIFGNLSRNKLRDAWYALSPVMKGKTARGRGTTTPRIDPNDTRVAGQLDESLILKAFATEGAEWIGKPDLRGFSRGGEFRDLKLHAYEIFFGNQVPRIRLDDDDMRNSSTYKADAIAAVGVTGADDALARVYAALLLHGIEVARCADLASADLSRLPRIAASFDYFWLAIPMPEDRAELDEIVRRLPESIGVLGLMGYKLQRLRQAQRSPDTEQCRRVTCALTKALLASRLKQIG